MALKPEPNRRSAEPTPQPDPSGAVSPPNPATRSAADADVYGATTPPPADRSPPPPAPAPPLAQTPSGDARRNDRGERIFGAGGTRVEIIRDYWPKEQPPQDPNARVQRENRVRAGETVELSSEEAMDLIEIGAAKRAR